MYYNERVQYMKTIRWNLEKAKLIQEMRNIDFERIATMINNSHIYKIMDVPNRINQKMFVLDYDGYAVCVPFFITENEIFIKTVYRSRKCTKMLRGKV